MSRQCTIYLLTNTKNGKIYVGQTWNAIHNRMGKNGSCYKNSTYLYNAIRRYGVDSFRYKVLAKCDIQERADDLEKEYIIRYDSRNPKVGYNIKEGGGVGRHSDETKVKISNALRNKVWSQEALRAKSKTGKLWKGKKRGPHTDLRKRQIGQQSKNWHATHEHPMKGRHHSEAAKLKIGIASLGRKDSLETTEKRRLVRLMTPERERAIFQAYQNGDVIAKIEQDFNTSRSSIYRILKRNNFFCDRPRDGWLGRTHSKETKEKMAAARSLHWKKVNG